MKRSNISPYIILLIPILLILALLSLNPISPEKMELADTATYFTVPDFKVLVRAVF